MSLNSKRRMISCHGKCRLPGTETDLECPIVKKNAIQIPIKASDNSEIRNIVAGSWRFPADKRGHYWRNKKPCCCLAGRKAAQAIGSVLICPHSPLEMASTLPSICSRDDQRSRRSQQGTGRPFRFRWFAKASDARLNHRSPTGDIIARRFTRRCANWTEILPFGPRGNTRSCVAIFVERHTGSPASRVALQSYSLTGRWGCGVAPGWELYELRGSRTVLREPRGAIPRGYSPFPNPEAVKEMTRSEK